MTRFLKGMGSGWAGGLVGGCLMSTVLAGVTRSEFGSPPLKWNFDQYLTEWMPDQNPSTRAIRYHLGTTVSRRGVQSNEWNAVRSAFAQWQAIPGTKIRFEEAEPVSNPSNVSALDGRNDVVWLSPGTYGQGDLGERVALGAGTIALTLIALDIDFLGGSSGTLIEADILINRELDYITDFESGSTSRTFLESAVLHEVGHWLGMNHTPLGAASMWWYLGSGVTTTAGLSSDEIAFARAVYGTPATKAGLGTLRGTVRLGGNAVLGAVVAAETLDGLIVAGTMSEADGSFDLPGLPPGQYRLRVAPADPNAGGDASLVRGVDVDVSVQRRFAGANTGFLPMTDGEVAVGAGAVVTRNLTVTGGNPVFRMTEVRTGLEAGGRASGDLALRLPAGQSNRWVGVFVPGTVAAGAQLRVTGPGLEFGETVVLPGALRQMTLVQVPVTIAADAPEGLRSLELTAGGYTAVALGFAEVAPLKPDYDFNGLDDRFQRRYFAPWTRAEAGPEMDPDGDGFVNRREALMGSDPTSALSVAYRVTRVRMTTGGATVRWESAPGRRYQLWSRDELGREWVKVGVPVMAAGEETELSDGRPLEVNRFYRVGDAP